MNLNKTTKSKFNFPKINSNRLLYSGLMIIGAIILDHTESHILGILCLVLGLVGLIHSGLSGEN
jgi:hypothetical protein